MYSPVLLVMIVDDSLNYHAYWNTNSSRTIIDYHGPSCSLDKFKYIFWSHDKENLLNNQELLQLMIISFILVISWS